MNHDPSLNPYPDHSESGSSVYRAYLIGHGGKVESCVTIDAEDDQTAIVQARDLTRSYEVELWDRSRMVVRLETLPKTSP